MSLIVERSKITGKGQVQIPANIREAAGDKIGDEVEFIKKRPLTEFAGALPPGRPGKKISRNVPWYCPGR